MLWELGISPLILRKPRHLGSGPRILTLLTHFSYEVDLYKVSQASRWLVSIVALLSCVIVPSIPAKATTLSWPVGGTFIVGGAQWQFNEYGLEYAWDVGDVWESDGYLYYPNEFSFSHDPATGDGGDYFLCGDPDTFTTEVEITQLNNGEITIVCPEISVPGFPNLVSQLEFKLYAEADSGYLLRQIISVTNSSDNYEAIPDLELQNFPNLHTDYWQGQYLGHEEAEWFVDSINDPFVGWLWEDATFFSQGMGDGRAVSVTNSWAKTGEAEAAHYFTDNTNNLGNPYEGSGAKLRTDAPNYFAPESTTRFLTFTNMVLPADDNPTSGAEAKAITLAQNQEFSEFSGRLIEGLPECSTYVGWGTTPGTCNLPSTGAGVGTGTVPSPEPCFAALAKTGFDIFISLFGGLAAIAVGFWFMNQSRKNRKMNRGRVRGLLFPEA